MHRSLPLVRALSSTALALALSVPPTPISSGFVASAGTGCDVTGTAQDDVLKGTRGSDTICGLGGNDVILGRGGNDTLRGDRGSDAIFGGGDDDRIEGGPGLDRLEGGSGGDALVGGTGDDQCESGIGDTASSCSPLPSSDLVLGVAGDIACPPGEDPDEDSCQMRATSDLLLENHVSVVLTTGDNQYDDGELENFQRSYASSWGRLKAITHPSPGNHDFHISGAAGYFDYFGPLAGPARRGYYSFNINDWHFVSLTSECDGVDGCNIGDPQYEWLADDLAADDHPCTLAYWHHPRFAAGNYEDNDSYEPFWQLLFEEGAEIVLNGHDHNYQHYRPQDPAGNADANGIREFIVGTGGRSHYSVDADAPNRVAADGDTFGVLLLTLGADGYDWSFEAIPGGSFTDSGNDTCH